jgi:3-oxoacyl-[acyl-carrier-protein] synthase-3
MAAAEIAERSGIPEQVIVEKFGLRGKHIAAPDEHVSDISVKAAEKLFADHDVDPESIDAVVYFGSTWKDYPVWQVAPWITTRLGCTNAFAVEFDQVSCGTPVAMRMARNLLVAEPELRNVLLVAACRESYLLDYTNERSRFMFNFGDGGVAGLLVCDHPENEVLRSSTITDGTLSLQVKVPAGGSAAPAWSENDGNGRFKLDVADIAGMKQQLDSSSLDNFVRAAELAADSSGVSLADVDYLCGLHMKRSMHDALVAQLGVERCTYLDDTGHMSGVDSLLALDRAWRNGELRDGDLVLLLAAGTGYTWAATLVRWGPLA